MLITCLRHATAEPHTVVDADRALVKKGKNQVKRVADFCRKNALLPGALFSSPLRRAEQTATTLKNQLPDCPPVCLVDWLGPAATVSGIAAELQKLAQAGVNDVWLVGHEPDFSELIGHLLDVPAARFLIKKASLTRIAVDFSGNQSGQLLWTIPCGLMD